VEFFITGSNIAQPSTPTTQCVVIEDSAIGITSAKAAGCKCIGITATHSVSDLAHADIIVNSFSQSQLIQSCHWTNNSLLLLVN
jgi:beta-phosphoglucomutase-like phosphatase (HAD superfamily)